MKSIKRVLSLLIALTMMLAAPVNAAQDSALSSAVNQAASFMSSTVKAPQVGSVGGEWAIIGLARSGCPVPDAYYRDYYATVEKYTAACGGVLHQKKYTEYSRLIVALSAIGKDPANVAGYNLLTPLGDYNKTIWQGLNGPIWALIALDCRNYPIPQNPSAKTQATRDMYVDRILACQLPDGGFSLFGGTAAATAGDQVADPDITGMALQALAKYQHREDVKKVTAEAVACLSRMQDANGGFSSWGTSNSESAVQVITALGELGISLDDSRFVKNGKTLLDNLMTYQRTDGSFQHTADGSGSNQMASEQGFYGLVAAKRAKEGKNSLYRMSDAMNSGSSPTAPSIGSVAEAGLPGKHTAVHEVPITKPGTTYSDIVFSDWIAAIEALASREIISGMGNGTFSPEQTMTRSQFAAIIVRALGLTPAAKDAFTDVPAEEWYAPYVGTAETYGIVTGRSKTAFDPSGTITRQEAAVMTAKAAKLCGMEIPSDNASVRDVLAQFSDYVSSDDWARSSLAFCYSQDILSQKELLIRSQDPVTRGEVAQMLFNLLSKAKLL